MPLTLAQEVLIDYTNYRGERKWYRIQPLHIIFNSSEWHLETQWLLEAFDVDRSLPREFAIKDIHQWKAP